MEVYAKGLATFIVVMVETNVTENVSATLIKLSNQFINIVTELKLINVVLPPTDPVTDIV